MAQGDPRTFTLYRDHMHGTRHGPWNLASTDWQPVPSDTREVVPVIEAVLSDELVEKVARAIDRNAAGCADARSRAAVRDKAREVLRAAGFRDPGEAESDG